MATSKEAKVGLLAAVSVTLLVLGFNYLRGNKLFAPDKKKIYAVFSEIGYLQKGNQVKIKGNSIGEIDDKQFLDANASGILVTIALEKDVNIPDNSIAVIIAPIAGSAYIDIRPGDSKNYLNKGDTLVTGTNTNNYSLIGTITQKSGILLDSLLRGLHSISLIIQPETKEDTAYAKETIQEIINTLEEYKKKLSPKLSPISE